MKLLNVPLGLLINFHESRLIDGVSRLILPVPIPKPLRSPRPPLKKCPRSQFLLLFPLCSRPALSSAHCSNPRPILIPVPTMHGIPSMKRDARRAGCVALLFYPDLCARCDL